MNIKVEHYFDQLSKDREHIADILDVPAMRGMKNSVVEKYSDQAHFIYELLQNADDAKATSARFVLHKDKLIFAHNGTRRFSVSNPATEAEDSENGVLGDINAITSIANSNKREQEGQIGKFGVGFKSVFQYTSTPHIYDPNIYFKIERFILPTRISEDFPGRKTDETLFFFPFDHAERDAAEAYEDISEKLRALDYPLLFLSCLENILFEDQGSFGLYGKYIEQKQQLGDTVAELITLTQNDCNELFDDKLWLFSRSDSHGLNYSVGFFLDEKGNLVPKQHSAFCFFPTKEVTNLNFIIHGPFLLTDSREGIRAGELHNKEMIQLLAALAADSLIYLRDIGQENGYPLINDEIFDLIPYDESKFSDVNGKSKISFKPFYTTILGKMSNDELLPASDGFVSMEDAYWAYVPQITELFTNAQLATISGNEKAKWIFRSFGRQDTRRKNEALTKYIDSITHVWIDEDDIINGWKFEGSKDIVGGISSAFIEAQSVNWLHSFYRWVAETSGRTKLIKMKPIFLNQDKKAVAVFDANKQVVLFLPTETEGYNTVLPDLLENKDTAEFLKQLGVERPSLRDEIYNRILPIYKENNGGLDTAQHFLKFFKFYKECPQTEVAGFIKLIKECQFVKFRSASVETIYRGKASNLYLPNEVLRKWFQAKPDTNFIEFDYYLQLVGESDKEELIQFFTDLGVKDEPVVLSHELNHEEAYEISFDWPYSTRPAKWIEKYIDGCEEIIGYLIEKQDADLSKIVWDQLLKYVEYGYSYDLRSIMRGKYEYFYFSPRTKEFDSSEALRLRAEPWLLNGDGEFVSAGELTIQTLSPQYNTSRDEAVELLQYLGIDDEIEETDYVDDNLTDEQRAKIALAESLSDIPPEELKSLVEQYRANKHSFTHQPEGDETDEEEEIDAASENPAVSRIAKEISKRAVSATKEKETDTPESEEATIDADEDDYTKPSIDLSKKIEQAKQRSAKEIAEIAQLDDLTQKALKADKYSYGWFKALLELESMNSGENTANSREISITFSKVEREEGTARTLILKHPSRYIPQSMEDLADIPLELHFANQPMVKVAVEVVNVKSYTLRAKLRTNAQIDGVDLSLVTEARIEAKNPVFLLEEQRKAFNNLNFDDDFDMQSNLCENIEFVFGPPGTGKTTHLAGEVILPLMQEDNNAKVLVLTPTNKAADVLVRRLMELDKNHSYTDWLVRFGATNDSVIEQSHVFRDKTFDIRALPSNVTVTTIARFPYDYFLPDGDTRLHLNSLKWDYIIIDEASMIPLVNIVYPLYKKTPEKFIIAGDPFQIEPITTVDIWKNENIYTMVELQSFTDPTTIPHQYHVELLTTQYRSTPDIGEVFSQYSYGGVLLHHRTEKDRRPLLIDDFIDIKPLNIIKFPVSKYESIYRPKRLQSKSNYQIYSALFAFEFVKYMSSLLEMANGNESFRIGLIAPYRAQSDLIDKLMSSFTFPKNIDVQVGTIHGFQGDECDIIIALFNPPPRISASKDMFLNKLNIINVSISRARDYLFIIMPDDTTENIGNLTMIKTVENLCKKQPNWIEHESPNIEEVIFGSNSYLEDNSFSTSHQLVNVYGKPEKRYEVRSEENAVDVQIHDRE
ncbi:AAA domain-containing protein [Bacillus sp. MUM 13]|uniref:AAA domain-containing protein n=1 Tax=Bacillus sp. MUM 13 TaxID=1678001 RepID=UPI0008F5A555|nr:AAA domain-containing protein [Bacillus sp. MUM 13]OIK07422.1 DNA helicase [Bacillus sp. MUM 13]